MAAAGKATLIQDQSIFDKAGGAIKAVATKVKAANNAAKAAKKNLSFAFSGSASPFDEVNAAFDHVRSFAASGGGFAGYKEKMLALADKLNTVGAEDDSRIPVIFSGRDDDPLFAGWKYTKSAIVVMPEEVAKGAGGLLLKPFEAAGAVISQTLTRVLNAQWQNEVVKPFVNRFSGRYPFSVRGEDASWNDVMDFFRPSSGTFWGFYDRVLSPYIVKTSSGWMVRQLGGLQLNFNPELSSALNGADVIRSIFFKPDGTLRTLDITVTPEASNKNGAKLEVDGQVSELAAGRTAQLRWPLESQASSRGAVLKIQVSRDFWQEVNFSGPWGFMKLVNSARVNKLNNSTFAAKWQVNVQNMYVLNYDARFQVSASDHPFTEPVFQRFTCPAGLIMSSPAAQE